MPNMDVSESYVKKQVCQILKLNLDFLFDCFEQHVSFYSIRENSTNSIVI